MLHSKRSEFIPPGITREEGKEPLYREIDDRKKAEDALRNINQKLQILNETAIILNAEKYTSGFYADISHKLMELTGGSSVTLSVYDPVTRCIHGKYAEIEHNALNDLFRALGGKKVTEVGFLVSDVNYQLLAAGPIRYFDSLSEAPGNPTLSLK